jgi:hypothetical protein
MIIVSIVLMLTSTVLADEMTAPSEYGHLRGRFVYDGAPPKPALLKLSGEDKEELEKLGLVDESLVVNSENRGVANIAVWLQPRADEKLSVHPSLQRASDRPEVKRVVRIVGGRITPRVTLLRVDEILDLHNDDPRETCPYGLGTGHLLRSGETLEARFPDSGFRPKSIGCRIYPWMNALVLVQQHPYMAVTDADGRFEIHHIPAGKHRFRFWQERARGLTKLANDGEQSVWGESYATIEIRADDAVDLGEIKSSPALVDRN